MSGETRSWDEYGVRCTRWVRDISGKKVWETVNLGAADEKQARQFYAEIKHGQKGALLSPQLIVQHITEEVLDD